MNPERTAIGSTPRLARSAVAFADVLGTSAKTEDPVAAELFLGALVDAMGHGQRMLHADELFGLKWQWFSDNVCISAPGGDHGSVALVVQSVGMLAAAFAERGAFLRGALTVGLHYQEDAVAFGPGLVEAVELERNEAGSPRIILSTEARLEALASEAGSTSPLAIDLHDDKGYVFIDFIQYLRAPSLLVFASKIAEALRRVDDQARVRAKLRWLEAYYMDRTGRRLDGQAIRGSRKERFVVLGELSS